VIPILEFALLLPLPATTHSMLLPSPHAPLPWRSHATHGLCRGLRGLI
jgi:hypothetical protein